MIYYHPTYDGMQNSLQVDSFSNIHLTKPSDRPWLFDDLDAWLDRCSGAPYKLAVIFVDNSGGDIVLGVFPFARDLLLKGTKVFRNFSCLFEILYLSFNHLFF